MRTATQLNPRKSRKGNQMNDDEQEIIDDVEPTTEPTTEPDPITGETDVEDESEEFDEDMAEETPQDGDNTPDLRAVTALATRTVQVDEIITDYSAESLAAYEAAGFTAYAVYDDGTEVQVPWSSVTEPPTLNDVISLEGLDVAMANNQHFWHNTDDAEASGGAGAHITDDTQDAWKQAVADGFPDLGEIQQTDEFVYKGATGSNGTFTLSYKAANTDSIKAYIGGEERTTGITKTRTTVYISNMTYGTKVTITYDTDRKKWHNLLMNSLGILLRTGLNHLVSITRSAIAFFDGNGNESENIVARFGTDGFQAGMDSKSHMIGDYHSLQLVDEDNTTYFHVSDLRDENGVAHITDVFRGDGKTKKFPASCAMKGTSRTSTVNGVSTACSYEIPYGEYEYHFVFDTAPADGAVIRVSYDTETKIKVYTAGSRSSEAAMGQWSFVEGFANGAAAFASHAEGWGSCAWGKKSHAEGGGSEAWGEESHAEGDSTKAIGASSHAEGDNTTARGVGTHAEGRYCETGPYAMCAHAEGWVTKANGQNSHAQNNHTIADGMDQTVLGCYNVPDGQWNAHGNYAVIVGNGTSDSARSNALTVDWDGGVDMAGSLLLQSSNIDRDGANPSSSTNGNSYLRLVDKDSEYIGSVYPYRLTTGEQRTVLQATSEQTDGTQVSNALSVGVKRDGTRTYVVSDAAAFREAINAVACSNQADIDASLNALSAAGQIWAIWGNCTNAANTYENGHRLGLCFTNTGMFGYRSNTGGATAGTLWSFTTQNTSATGTSVITIAANHTLDSATYNARNGVVQVRIAFKTSSTATGTRTIGTIVSGKRPAALMYGSYSSSTISNCYVEAGGAVKVYFNSAPSTSNTYGISFMYLLPSGDLS